MIGCFIFGEMNKWTDRWTGMMIVKGLYFVNRCRLCLAFLFLWEYYILGFESFWCFCERFRTSPLKTSDNIICSLNSLIFFVCFSQVKKKKLKSFSFSLWSNIKAHARLQSHINFWTAVFIILLLRGSLILWNW